jgi:hypothetical protein
MKSFLIKLISLFICTSCIIIILFYFLKIRINNKTDWTLDHSTNLLIIGDSHTQVTLNDSLISHSVNLSSGAQAYVYCFAKTRMLVNNNPQIKTVILSFAFHNLPDDSYQSDWIKKWGMLNLIDFCHFMKTEEIIDVIRVRPELSFYRLNQCMGSILHLIANPKKRLSLNDLNLGGYYFLAPNRVKEDIIKKTEGVPLKDIRISRIQEKYLFKLIRFCDQHEIKLILINTPLHPIYLNSITSYKSFYYNYYHKKLCAIKLLDLSNYSMPDSCYSDLSHLNYRGANIISKMIENKIEDYQL